MVKNDELKNSEPNAEARILEAAKKVIFSKGYAGARMQDIADEAGINKALLHYYFRSKDKLFEVIFSEATGKLMPQISSAFSDPDMGFDGKVRAFCALYINTWMEQPYLPMFVLHEMHTNPERSLGKLFDGDRFRPILQMVLKAIETAVKKKQIRRVEPHQLFLNMISLCMFPFMGSPVFKKVTGITDKQFEMMMRNRVSEVSEFIIESIKYRK